MSPVFLCLIRWKKHFYSLVLFKRNFVTLVTCIEFKFKFWIRSQREKQSPVMNFHAGAKRNNMSLIISSYQKREGGGKEFAISKVTSLIAANYYRRLWERERGKEKNWSKINEDAAFLVDKWLHVKPLFSERWQRSKRRK